MFSPEEFFLNALFGFLGSVLTVLVFKLLEWMGEERHEYTERKKQPQENDEGYFWKGGEIYLLFKLYQDCSLLTI